MSVHLAPLEELDAVRELARRIYEDPANRAATGWFDPADKTEAIEALVDLWERRSEAGWSVSRVLRDGATIGLAGHGPVDAKTPPGLAVYLLERGQGIGPRIAAELVDRVRAAGAQAMSTVAHAENTASHRMLEAVGFEPVGPCTADWAQASDEPWLTFRLAFEADEAASRKG